jgi:hypothetical protein
MGEKEQSNLVPQEAETRLMMMLQRCFDLQIAEKKILTWQTRLPSKTRALP